MSGYAVAVLVDLDDFLENARRHGPAWADGTRDAAERVVRSTCGARPGTAIEPRPPDSWLVVLSRPTAHALAAEAHTLAVRLRGGIAEHTQATASVAISTVTEGHDGPDRAAREAQATLHRKVLGGTRLVLATTGHRDFDPPDIARDVATRLRAAATADAVARVEWWVGQALHRQVHPALLFDVWLPGLVIEVATLLDPRRAADGSTNWRSTLTHVPVADLAALGEMHERSVLHRWLSQCFAHLAEMATRDEPAPLADRADELLRNRFTDPDLTLGQAAAELAVSPFHLAHVLKRDRNTTFRRYLTGLRVRKAIGLLGSAELRVGEVGTLCGFSSVRQFRTTMRRETGYPPTRLRGAGELTDQPPDVAADNHRRLRLAETGEHHAAQ